RADVGALRDGDAGWIKAQHLDIANRNRQARRIDNPHGGLLVELCQSGRWNLDDRDLLDLHAAGHGGAEPHRLRRIGQANFDLKGPRRRIGLGRDLAHAPARRYPRIVGEAHSDLWVAGRRADQLCRNVEDGVASVLAGKPDDHLAGLNDLASSRAYCGYDTWCISLERSEAHQIMRGLQLRLGRVDLRLRGLLRLL